MRILLANDGVGDPGGVQRYLEGISSALRARGHELALLHLDPVRSPSDSPIGPAGAHFCAADRGVDGAVQAGMAWRPHVVFSHNMRALDVDRLLCSRAPVVKMMHGYFGTCIGGQKMHAFPHRVACERTFGASCRVLYLPRRCGAWGVHAMAVQYAWARAQQEAWGGYRSVVVASDHMRREYQRNGMAGDRLVVNPLFTTDLPEQAAAAPADFRVVFLGRMTPLKGGDHLVRAVSMASRSLGAPIRLTMAGDGPARAAWARLSESLGVAAEFPGWVGERQRRALYRSASLVAVPSLWPEPFGLTGLEGGAFGAAAVAYNVGGISTWLHDGENGWLIDPHSGPDGLARAIVHAASEPETLAERRRGARLVAEHLSLERHVAALEILLRGSSAEGDR